MKQRCLTPLGLTPWLLALAAIGSACEELGIESPNPEDPNRFIHAVPSEEVDDTPADASFEAGQRRSVADADVTLTLAAASPAPFTTEYALGVVMPGDLDGDGVDDLVTYGYQQAPSDVIFDHCEGESCPAFVRLSVHIFYGADAARLEPSAQLLGSWVHNWRLWVEAAGDIDGNGRQDLLISEGARGSQANVRVLRGGPRLAGRRDIREVTSLIRETEAGVGLHLAAGLGDLDGDGKGDFVVDRRGLDQALVFYGDLLDPERRSEADADLRIEGAGVLRPVGDINGDQIPDVVSFSSSELPRVGEAEWRVLLGRRAVSGPFFELAAVIPGALLVASLGDVDGDGLNDLGVSREQDCFVLAGRRVWPERIEDADARLRWAPTSTATFSALSVRAAGDVNGDGHEDLAYVDPNHGPDGRGAVHLYLGPLDLTQAELDPGSSSTLIGQAWRGQNDFGPIGLEALGGWGWLGGFGFVGGSDLDGDGYDDMALLGFSPRGANDSHLYLWRGRP
ncbi:MAG: VCBS repeat-containing protein [Myxococcota bacterium]